MHANLDLVFWSTLSIWVTSQGKDLYKVNVNYLNENRKFCKQNLLLPKIGDWHKGEP